MFVNGAGRVGDFLLVVLPIFEALQGSVFISAAFDKKQRNIKTAGQLGDSSTMLRVAKRRIDDHAAIAGQVLVCGRQK